MNKILNSLMVCALLATTSLSAFKSSNPRIKSVVNGVMTVELPFTSDFKNKFLGTKVLDIDLSEYKTNDVINAVKVYLKNDTGSKIKMIKYSCNFTTSPQRDASGNILPRPEIETASELNPSGTVLIYNKDIRRGPMVGGATILRWSAFDKDGKFLGSFKIKE